MTELQDSPTRYGAVSRALHWGMAILFLFQFLSAAAHWALPRENGIRDVLWSYHSDLGLTLFVLVGLRGLWGLMNLSRRPVHDGPMGKAAAVGHAVLYLLMIVVPGVRVLSSIGGTRVLSYLGVELFSGQTSEIAWMSAPAGLHGELGWLLLFVIVGHILMAVGYHRLLRRDDTLAKMAG